MISEREIMKMLEYAIQRDRDIYFVCGFGPYIIPSDLLYGKDRHLTAVSVSAYHKYAKMHPELKLGERLTSQIMEVLAEEKYHILPYLIFKVIDEELKIEKTEKAAFSINEESCKKILVELKRQIEKLSDEYKNDKSMDGQWFKDGIYGYLAERSEEIERSTGFHFWTQNLMN